MQSYSRHKLKEDKFKEAAKGTVHWTVAHRKLIIIVLVVAGVIAVVTASLLAYSSKKDEQASAAMGHALRTYSAPLRQPNQPVDPKTQSFLSLEERAQAAHKEFQQVADQYPHTEAGKNARYLAAVTTLEAGDTATAEKELKEIANSRSRDRSSLAKLTLASLYRSTNRDPEAVNIYKDLLTHPTDAVPKATVEFALADAYATTQPEEAKRIYDELSKDKSRNIAQLAEQKRAALK